MQWLTDRIDGIFRAWEAKQLALKKDALKEDRIVVRIFEKKYPAAFFLDKPIGNGECIVHSLFGPNNSITLKRFLETHQEPGEENANAINTMLEELKRIGYNPVVVDSEGAPVAL